MKKFLVSLLVVFALVGCTSTKTYNSIEKPVDVLEQSFEAYTTQGGLELYLINEHELLYCCFGDNRAFKFNYIIVDENTYSTDFRYDMQILINRSEIGKEATFIIRDIEVELFVRGTRIK